MAFDQINEQLFRENPNALANAPAPTHYEVNNLVMQHWSTDNV
jgi:hypothetical protein